MEKKFINEFITLGMNDYFVTGNNTFERHIIECLIDIYGEKEMKTFYESLDENGFTQLIYKYGLKNTVYENFLRDTMRYETFKVENQNNPLIKSDIASIVESSVINMFITKYLKETPDSESISHFENNLLNNFEVVKMQFSTCLDPNRTRNIWNKKKKILDSNVELIEVKPNYLDEFTYRKFGIDINDVKKMDYRMVKELNRYVIQKQKLKDEIDKKPGILGNTVLSSGNGKVDALLVASIIATEISILLIYLFIHMG